MTYLMVATTAAVYAILATDSDKEVRGREREIEGGGKKGGEKRSVRRRKRERGEKNLPCSSLGNRLGEEGKGWEVEKERRREGRKRNEEGE